MRLDELRTHTTCTFWTPAATTSTTTTAVYHGDRCRGPSRGGPWDGWRHTCPVAGYGRFLHLHPHWLRIFRSRSPRRNQAGHQRHGRIYRRSEPGREVEGEPAHCHPHADRVGQSGQQGPALYADGTQLGYPPVWRRLDRAVSGR